ncbi:MAG: SDR family NAD(P)-dependent oxidoreductase [Caldilineaceae bacterium]
MRRRHQRAHGRQCRCRGASLAADHPTGQILGAPGDIGVAAQVQALWDAAVARFGRVDIWINNAGLETARCCGTSRRRRSTRW